MATGRVPLATVSILLLGLAAPGCSQPNPFTSRQTMVGSLKASVSQLEFENEKLKKEVGELKAENTKLDSQLAREQELNGEVSARLDDAKDMIRKQGGNTQALGNMSRNSSDDDFPPPVQIPRSKATRSSRKSPTVQIPSPDEPAPFGSSNDGFGPQTSTRTSPDIGSSDNADDRWLPVARGMGTTVR